MEQESKAAKEKKSGFRKVTIAVPPVMYERLIKESARRKIAGEENHLFSEMLREAVDRYLEHLGDSDWHPDRNKEVDYEEYGSSDSNRKPSE